MAAAKAKPEKASAGGEVVPLYRPRKCPICGKPSVRAYHPFSSKRCADIDLNQWLSGRYAIPSTDPVPDSEAPDDEA